MVPLYDAFCALLGLGRRFKEQVLGAVPIQPGAVVADIGCGTGVLLAAGKAKHPAARFIGIDPDEQALAIAKQRLQKAALDAELLQAYAEALPLPGESVDVCFSTLAFHHMPNEVKYRAVREMYRVLRPSGQAVIADFGPSQSRGLRRLLFFEKLEYLEGNLQGLIPRFLGEAGFQNIAEQGRHFPGVKIIVAQKSPPVLR